MVCPFHRRLPQFFIFIAVIILIILPKNYKNLTTDTHLKISHVFYEIISPQQIEAHFAQIHTIINKTLQLVAVRLAVNYFPLQLTLDFLVRDSA